MTRKETIAKEGLAVLLVVAPLIAGAGLMVWYSHAAVPGVGEPQTRVFNLTGVAGRGVWTLAEVSGLNYWWKQFEPANLHVQEGEQVVLNLRSADLFHRFYLPAFGVGPVDVEPGHMATVRFRVSRAGVYQYYCTSMCGSCHFYMRGWLVVTAAGQSPVEPPPISCRRCRQDLGPRPAEDELTELGAWIYLDKGCDTCHGPEGRGGVANDNAANSPVPPHDATAQKLFLASQEDAEAFADLVARAPDLGTTPEPPEIARFPVVRARFDNAREIIRLGRYSAKRDPAGPEPPLQMPAWQFLLAERDIDALLVYFVSLQEWEEGDA